MKYKVLKLFNMIELTLAIGILAIGSTAVLALFPIGVDKNKNSIGENYCAESASDFTAYVNTMALADWSGMLSSLPLSKPDISSDGPVTDYGNWTPISSYDVSCDIYELSGPEAVNGCFGLRKTSEGVTDFTGKALVWRADVGTISSNITTGVFIEINWPVNRKYAFRRKNYYYFEMFNYNQ